MAIFNPAGLSSKVHFNIKDYVSASFLPSHRDGRIFIKYLKGNCDIKRFFVYCILPKAILILNV